MASKKPKRKARTLLVITCPGGCGWKSKPTPDFEVAENEYTSHLVNDHYGALYCVFCPAALPDFATLYSHIETFHPGKPAIPRWVIDAIPPTVEAAPVLNLWTPCKLDAKVSWPGPVLLRVKIPSGQYAGEQTNKYACARCGQTFDTRKACYGHMGFIMNRPASCRMMQ